MALVTLKYVAIIMRANNRGEGGSLALLALITDLTKNSRATYFVTMLGIFAAALFYGDSMITPAISVLSAVEGLDVVAPELKHYVMPITIVVLCVLFFQRRGTELIGALFGPIMCVWFATLAVLGVVNILHEPGVLAALSPVYGVELIIRHPWESFLARRNLSRGDGRRSAVRRHGALRTLSDPACLVLPRAAGAGVELLRAGGPASPRPEQRREPVLSPRPGLGARSDGGAGHRRDRDRISGGDLRRVLGRATGRSARLSSAHDHNPHLVQRGWPNLFRSRT